MRKWLVSIFRKLFSSDRNYRYDYVLENIHKIDSKLLLSIRINALTNKSDEVLSFHMLKDTFEEFRRIIDEEYDTTINILYGCVPSKNMKVSLQSMLYKDNYLDGNYVNLLKDVLVLYNKILSLTNDVLENKESTSNQRYNCNLFRLYIITMEDIINKLFISLSED